MKLPTNYQIIIRALEMLKFGIKKSSRQGSMATKSFSKRRPLAGPLPAPAIYAVCAVEYPGRTCRQ